ncbi:hypothetical protein HU200_016472 [Digitaria exilis]|uniref:F-box domain-containing protein n=1 Tax=Digitaria exilis TaxID=1010633 RepID=A0A835F892_9POAL|nr:hypothetical protein HU200_016472 [Digitaria exilis]
MEDYFSFQGLNQPFQLPPGFLSLGVGATGGVDYSTSPSLLPMAAPPIPMAPPLRSSPQLPDEILEDIFVLLPPDDPARLLWAALACKRFARLIAGRDFRHRYRQHNSREPPMLGFLANLIDNAGITRFIPTTIGGGHSSFRPVLADHDRYRAHDACHGRVLLTQITGLLPGKSKDADVLVVWNPTTGELQRLPLLPRRRHVLYWNAAILCGDATAACGHIDCHPGPFTVVFISMEAYAMFSYVYSSNTHAWSVTSLADLPDDILHESSRGALARNALYFMLRDETFVLKYNLATSIISQIAVPQRPDGRSLLLMTMEDGGLGFADVDFFGHDLRLWAMEDDHPEGVGWILRTVISLSEHLPPRALRSSPDAVAFAEVVGVIFLSTSDGLYTFDLKTRKGNRIMSNRFYDIVPYVSFYTPALKAALPSSGEGSSADNVVDASFAQLPDDILHERSQGALARNMLYFMLHDGTYICTQVRSSDEDHLSGCHTTKA